MTKSATLLLILLTLVGSPAESYLVDDFTESEVGVLPLDWNLRRASELKEYWVEADSTGQYMAARTVASDMMVVKEIDVDIVKYPFINWRWRVHELPTAGDESVKEVCDAPASIAIVTGASRIIPKSIKYTWSTTLPVGTVTESPFAYWPSRTDIVVLESGTEKQGQWVTEKRNILEDYKKLYGKSTVKRKRIRAIAIMSDSDNTASVSAADYDDIYFSAE